MCEPAQGEGAYISDGEVTARGYAWSMGGRDIIRVDILYRRWQDVAGTTDMLCVKGGKAGEVGFRVHL